MVIMNTIIMIPEGGPVEAASTRARSLTRGPVASVSHLAGAGPVLFISLRVPILQEGGALWVRGWGGGGDGGIERVEWDENLVLLTQVWKRIRTRSSSLLGRWRKTLPVFTVCRCSRPAREDRLLKLCIRETGAEAQPLLGHASDSCQQPVRPSWPAETSPMIPRRPLCSSRPPLFPCARARHPLPLARQGMAVG